jgi:hypothetical protein
MAESDSYSLSLLPHPDTPSVPVRRLAARAELVAPASLRLEYLLEADPAQIRIPPSLTEVGGADHLWAHTCFEAFVGREESPPYLELNFSPSGQWAAYRFETYRQGMAPAVLESEPRLAWRRSATGLALQAEVSLGGAPYRRDCGAKAMAGGRLRIALSAVVEDRQGGLSYWALRHPPGRPDFHHPDAFSLALAFPRKNGS